MGNGILIASPHSGSGKTVVTLGLLRALSRINNVRAAKSGPDYIDPAFHHHATGRVSTNLDTWAMKKEMIESELLDKEYDVALIEGSMGFFDGVGVL